MRSRNMRVIFSALVLVVAFAAPAAALDTYWQAGTGDWGDPLNWTNGVPDGDYSAYIDNGGTAVIMYGSTAVGGLYLGYNEGSMGACYLSAHLNSISVLIGYNGTGTFSHVGELEAMELVIGVYSGSMGTFTQTGGTNTVSYALNLGYESGSTGEFKLENGQLSALKQYIGNSGTGTFTQTGGTNTAQGGEIWLGYEIGSTGEYNLEDGQLSASDQYIGMAGTGTFTQSGGTNTVSGAMLLGYEFGTGTYNLNDGLLSASDLVIISGTFNQTGGTNTAGLLSVASSQGMYNMSGGTLNVFNLAVYDYGAMNISNSTAPITIGNMLMLGSGATLSAVPGTTIRMTGSSFWGSHFYNESTNEAALAGLANIAMVFEGGAEQFDVFEIAGRDFGADMLGFSDNFTLGQLTLGGEDVACLRLIDDFDNGNRGGIAGEAEALYVKHLVLTEGSTLDLNGYHLYYFTLDDQGGTFLNGALIQMIPEPGTLALIATALLGFAGIAFRKMGRR